MNSLCNSQSCSQSQPVMVQTWMQQGCQSAVPVSRTEQHLGHPWIGTCCKPWDRPEYRTWCPPAVLRSKLKHLLACVPKILQTGAGVPVAGRLHSAAAALPQDSAVHITVLPTTPNPTPTHAPNLPSRPRGLSPTPPHLICPPPTPTFTHLTESLTKKPSRPPAHPHCTMRRALQGPHKDTLPPTRTAP